MTVLGEMTLSLGDARRVTSCGLPGDGSSRVNAFDLYNHDANGRDQDGQQGHESHRRERCLHSDGAAIRTCRSPGWVYPGAI